MSAERHVDPELAQALERIRDELSTEERALAVLPGQNAELRARLEQLQAERERLHALLADAKQGRPLDRPRLPEVLAPSFEVRARGPLHRQLRDLLTLGMVAMFLLALPWNLDTGSTVFMGFIYVVASAFTQLKAWLDRPLWIFSERGIERGGRAALQPGVPYARLLDAEAQASQAQLRRGVGTVMVKYRAAPQGEAESFLEIADVPEPERLAEWLRSKRPQGE